MIHGILEMEDGPFLQRVLKYRLGTRALTTEGLAGTPYSLQVVRSGGGEAVRNLYVSRPRSLAIQSFMYGGQ